MGSPEVADIAKHAYDMRCDIIKMLAAAGSGHPGGSLSAADIVATLFFSDLMAYRADDPAWDGRDRFILSKGHAAPVLYAALAEAGYFPKEEIATLRKLGSRLQGHPDSKKLPGVEVSTGSLGQGLSISCGLAYGLARSAEASGAVPQTVFCLMGDGEQDEGQVWEAAMFAAQYRLSNLVAIVDNNGLQIDGRCANVMCFDDLAAKYDAFGWQVIQVDGHDIELTYDAIQMAKDVTCGPAVVIAHTVKGKGVSFMEDQAGWHGKAPDAEQKKQALADLEAGYARVLQELSIIKEA